MLEEKDRRALADIEQGLSASDPAFVRRMRSPRRRFPVISALCVTVFLMLPFIGLLFGPTAALIVADLAAVSVVMIMGYRHWRDQP